MLVLWQRGPPSRALVPYSATTCQRRAEGLLGWRGAGLGPLPQGCSLHRPGPPAVRGDLGQLLWTRGEERKGEQGCGARGDVCGGRVEPSVKARRAPRPGGGAGGRVSGRPWGLGPGRGHVARRPSGGREPAHRVSQPRPGPGPCRGREMTGPWLSAELPVLWSGWARSPAEGEAPGRRRKRVRRRSRSALSLQLCTAVRHWLPEAAV